MADKRFFCYTAVALVEEEKQSLKKAWWRESIVFFAKVSSWIAAPIVFSLFAGRWLDKKLDSAPWGFLALTVLAFTVSCIGIVKESSKQMRNINKTNGDRNDTDK